MEITALAPTRIRKQHDSRSCRTTWTVEEDDLLRTLVSQTGTNSWSVIAKYFPNKTAPQVSGRWEKVLNPKIIKGSWTREEDEIIAKFVAENGDKDWARLALLLNGRTGKQCRERFKNHLDPKVQKTAWTEEEDRRLIDLHNKLGNQWTLISSYFEGRSDNCIKNRWNSTLKKRIERIERGEPLVQKRGRKPKNLKIDISPPPSSPPEVPPPSSSPIEIPLTPTLHVMPLITDRFSSLLTKKTIETEKIGSLAQNRLDFQRLLSAVA